MAAPTGLNQRHTGQTEEFPASTPNPFLTTIRADSHAGKDELIVTEELHKNTPILFLCVILVVNIGLFLLILILFSFISPQDVQAFPRVCPRFHRLKDHPEQQRVLPGNPHQSQSVPLLAKQS